MNPDDLRSRAVQRLASGLHSYAQGPDGLPLIAQKGMGPYFHDTTGRQFLDWNMGWGSLLLGYRHPRIESALREQLLQGTLFSVPHALEVEVAEALCTMIPCAEKVAFGKNGSDACAAAVRIARAATGREGILQFGYHGFHDWSLVLDPAVAGAPSVLRPLIHPIAYNDLDSLRGILSEHGSRVAGRILEPMRGEWPLPGFLEGLRSATEENGSLLIFDEVVTGFRLARGGAQELFGVTPDLACFSKALSNGMPLSALVGRAELVDLAPKVGYGMTTRGESLALAAAKAALAFHAREPIAERVAATGESLRQGFAASCAKLGVGGRMIGHPSMMGVELPEGWLEPFLAGCLEGGVFTNGHFLASAVHEDTHVRLTCEVFDSALEACARRL